MCATLHEQNRYFIFFRDDYTRIIWVYFLYKKFQVFEIFKRFEHYVKKQSGCNIKTIRSERGKEYTSNEFNKFYEDEGIEHQLTVGHTPDQNDVSKRKNGIVIEIARTMLMEKGLPKTLWTEAVNIIVYLLNRCPTKAVQDKKPVKAWS